ncbi:MAG: hypothetical protein ABIQ44_12845, partial [Chloroflexia bacterium]
MLVLQRRQSHCRAELYVVRAVFVQWRHAHSPSRSLRATANQLQIRSAFGANTAVPLRDKWNQANDGVYTGAGYNEHSTPSEPCSNTGDTSPG